MSVPGGKVLFRTLEPLGLASKPSEPAVAFAACWLVADQECQVKLRMQCDTGMMVWLDHRRIWKGYQEGWKGLEDTAVASLSAGAHLLLLKVGTPGGSDFGFRVRVLAPSAERIAGLRVATAAPRGPKILYAEDFNQGRGAWGGGEIVSGGVDATSALAIPKAKGVLLQEKLPQRAGPTWTLRFKLKPAVEFKGLELIAWAGRDNSVFRHHLRGLQKDQWNQVEVKAAQLNLDWNGGGPTFEGEVPHMIRIYFDDNVPDGSVFLDDFEVLE